MLSRFLVHALGRVMPVIVVVGICPISPPAAVDLAFGRLSNALELEINIDKERFLVGEPVWIDVVLKNVSQDTVPISGRDIRPEHGNLEFFVAGGEKTLKYTGGFATYIGGPQNLAPGEEITSQFDIVDFYGKPVEGTLCFEKLLHPGMYSVQARVWRNVTSNALDMEVVEPSGEDAEIQRALHEASLLIGQRRREEAGERLCSVLPSASQSVYRDKLYFVLIRIAHTERPRQRKLAEQVLREYPDSRYAGPCLLRVFGGMSRAQAEEFVGGLESAVPGTRAAVRGRKLLETYEFRK